MEELSIKELPAKLLEVLHHVRKSFKKGELSSMPGVTISRVATSAEGNDIPPGIISTVSSLGFDVMRFRGTMLSTGKAGKLSHLIKEVFIQEQAGLRRSP